MKIYLVGGAVRDKLLGLPVKERDWVVVGATLEEMLKNGFQSVGKDFPVFLEPKTKEEYALARTERKVGRGYTGFDFNASVSVSLKDDLKRRDLTINAMAEDTEGHLIDYYGGKKDLDNKILRHVSPAFIEDPVRILRVARFAARYAQYGFTIAPETMSLMQHMVNNGEVDALVPERVWKELQKALTEKNPEQFFKVLADCHALEKLFPELMTASTLGENFLGESELLKVAATSQDPDRRFAALLSLLDQESIKNLCKRLRVPSEYRDLALHQAHLNKNLEHLKFNPDDTERQILANQILKIFKDVDAFRREKRFMKLLENAKGLESSERSLPEITHFLEKCYQEAKTILADEFINQGFVGKSISEKMDEAKKEKIMKLLKKNQIDGI